MNKRWMKRSTFSAVSALGKYLHSGTRCHDLSTGVNFFFTQDHPFSVAEDKSWGHLDISAASNGSFSKWKSLHFAYSVWAPVAISSTTKLSIFISGMSNVLYLTQIPQSWLQSCLPQHIFAFFSKMPTFFGLGCDLVTKHSLKASPTTV